MAYGLNPRLFVENGPAILAAKAHARGSSDTPTRARPLIHARKTSILPGTPLPPLPASMLSNDSPPSQAQESSSNALASPPLPPFVVQYSTPLRLEDPLHLIVDLERD